MFGNYQFVPKNVPAFHMSKKLGVTKMTPIVSMVGFCPVTLYYLILTRQPGIVPHLCVESHYFQFSTIYRIEFYQTLLFVPAGIFFNDGMKTNIYGIYRPFFFVLKQKALKLRRSSLKLTLRVSASSK